MIKKIPFLLLTMAVLLPATLSAKEVVRLTRYVGENLTGVSASHVFEVELVATTDTRAIVEISSELEPYLRFEKRPDGVVSVGMQIPQDVSRRLERSRNDYWKENKPKLILHLNTLSYIALSGAAKATASGTFNGDLVEIKMDGASNMGEVSLSARELKINVSGAAKTKINAASVTTAGLKVNGAAKLEINLPHTHSTGISLGGSANIRLSGGTQTLTVDASGSAKLEAQNYRADTTELKASGAVSIRLSGTTRSITATADGAAKVDTQNFMAERADVKASGAANITVHASQYLKAHTSAAAKVRYSGDPAEKVISNPNVSRIQ